MSEIQIEQINEEQINVIKEFIIKAHSENRKLMILTHKNEEIIKLLESLNYIQSTVNNNFYDLKHAIILNEKEEKDIELIMLQSECSREIAIETYIKFNYDVIETIMEITK